MIALNLIVILVEAIVRFFLRGSPNRLIRFSKKIERLKEKSFPFLFFLSFMLVAFNSSVINDSFWPESVSGVDTTIPSFIGFVAAVFTIAAMLRISGDGVDIYGLTDLNKLMLGSIIN